jgi:hypothetical protein
VIFVPMEAVWTGGLEDEGLFATWLRQGMEREPRTIGR